MLAFVSGILEYYEGETIVVDCNGIGYNIMIPLSDADRLPHIGNKVKIYTYMSVREDAIKLFGFLDRDELGMFGKLITVNGIGPKAALGILSALSPDDLRFAILSDNAAAIAKAPGIGPKTAGKVILELKDKIDLNEAFESKLGHRTGNAASGTDSGAGSIINSKKSEAIQALVVLGYSQGDAAYAVGRLDITEDMTDAQILKEALKHM